MSEETRQPSLDLNAIATKVLLDEDFEKLVLNRETRADALKEFQLSDQHKAHLLALGSMDKKTFMQELNKLNK